MRTICEGNEEKVVELLEELADSISVDRAIPSNAVVNISNIYGKNGLERVAVTCGKKTIATKSESGRGYTRLANKLDSKIEEKVLALLDYENVFEVLALSEEEPFKDYEGNVHMEFVVKSPWNRYSYDEYGHKQLRYETIILPEKEADMLMLNKLAIRYNGQLYGLSDTAVLSLSKLMDATKTMANLEELDAQIELAGFICAKLELNPTELKIVSWNESDSSDVVKIADTIGGSRLQVWRQDDIFKMVFRELSSMGTFIPSVGNFKVGHEATIIDINLFPMGRAIDYNLKVRLEMTDAVNVATAVTLVAEKDGVEFYLIRNKEGKRTELTEQIGKNLVKGIAKQLEVMPTYINKFRITAEKFEKLSVSIGDGRVAEMGIQPNEEMDIKEYARRAKAFKKELPPKQLVEFRELNGDLFKEAI